MKNDRASFMINNNILTYKPLYIESYGGLASFKCILIPFLFSRAHNLNFEPSRFCFRALADLSLVNNGFCVCLRLFFIKG